MKSLFASLFIATSVGAAGSETCLAISGLINNVIADSSFVITNISNHTLNLAGYSYDDGRRRHGAANLGQLGTLEPGESAIVTTTLIHVFCLQECSIPPMKILIDDSIDLKQARELNIFDGCKLVTRMSRRIELHSPFVHNATSAFLTSCTPGVSTTRPQNFTAPHGSLLDLAWFPAEGEDRAVYLKFSTPSR